MKGPHSKCGRSVHRRKGSNPFISVSHMDKEKHRDEESTQMATVTEKSRWLRGMQENLWKMASERRTELGGQERVIKCLVFPQQGCDRIRLLQRQGITD